MGSSKVSLQTLMTLLLIYKRIGWICTYLKSFGMKYEYVLKFIFICGKSCTINCLNARAETQRLKVIYYRNASLSFHMKWKYMEPTWWKNPSTSVNTWLLACYLAVLIRHFDEIFFLLIDQNYPKMKKQFVEYEHK